MYAPLQYLHWKTHICTCTSIQCMHLSSKWLLPPLESIPDILNRINGQPVHICDSQEGLYGRTTTRCVYTDVLICVWGVQLTSYKSKNHKHELVYLNMFHTNRHQHFELTNYSIIVVSLTISRV